jgi:hypothetical protein
VDGRRHGERAADDTTQQRQRTTVMRTHTHTHTLPPVSVHVARLMHQTLDWHWLASDEGWSTSASTDTRPPHGSASRSLHTLVPAFSDALPSYLHQSSCDQPLLLLLLQIRSHPGCQMKLQRARRSAVPIGTPTSLRLSLCCYRPHAHAHASPHRC